MDTAIGAGLFSRLLPLVWSHKFSLPLSPEQLETLRPAARHRGGTGPLSR